MKKDYAAKHKLRPPWPGTEAAETSTRSRDNEPTGITKGTYSMTAQAKAGSNQHGQTTPSYGQFSDTRGKLTEILRAHS